ncbi:hypothetical protein MAP00_000029 [Monascus purpureus]|nr:hypothetical protein MAP00_000029 [Monascus purpureus]
MKPFNTGMRLGKIGRRASAFPFSKALASDPCPADSVAIVDVGGGQAIQGQNTLQHQVSVVPGLVLMYYEPLLHRPLRDVEKEWAHIIGVGGDGSSPVTPFPLQLSDEETQQDGDLWAQGVELMNAFVDDTGCFNHWDGRVSDID